MKKKSPRRSSTSGISEPHDRAFFIDADISGWPLVDILKEAGLSLELHDDHFSQGTGDAEWLAAVGERGWIVLTRDYRIKQDSFKVQTLMRASARVFALRGNTPDSGNSEPGCFLRRMANNLVECLPAIDSFLNRHRDPFIARIRMPSKEGEKPASRIRMVLRYEDWLKSLPAHLKG